MIHSQLSTHPFPCPPALAASSSASQSIPNLLASQPLWLLVAACAWHEAGTPSMSQVWLAAGVALSAGVVATQSTAAMTIVLSGAMRAIPA